MRLAKKGKIRQRIEVLQGPTDSTLLIKESQEKSTHSPVALRAVEKSRNQSKSKKRIGAGAAAEFPGLPVNVMTEQELCAMLASPAEICALDDYARIDYKYPAAKPISIRDSHVRLNAALKELANVNPDAVRNGGLDPKRVLASLDPCAELFDDADDDGEDDEEES
jgi:hypothetical protein